jgi:erythritol kinase
VIADVTGVETVRTEDAQTGTKGALLTALTALGEQPDLTTAAALVRERDRFVPDSAVTALYDAEHAEFLATRELAAQRWRHWRGSR